MRDVIHFDLSCIDFLHKLGEGGFGTVRACKFRKASDRYRSPVSASTAANSSDEEDRIMKAAKPEESKFKRATKGKAIMQPRATSSGRSLEGAG